MTKPIDVAKYVCAKGGWAVTNLALQKILYVLQMVHLGRTTGTRLFEGTFQAWDYGPVEPSVYRSVNMFGSNPIQDGFAFRSAQEVQKDICPFLDEVCDFLSKKSASQLVALTHWKDGAWAKHYSPHVRGIEIPDADMLDEYRKRTNGN